MIVKLDLGFCCCSSVVERVLGKDEVMGSNPISSSDCVGLDFVLSVT